MHHLTASHYELTWAFILLALGAARLTRLIVHDVYPPMLWLRVQYLRRLPDNSEWGKLVECHYCASPYVVAGLGAWGYFTDLQLAWWLVVGWLAVTYVAAIVVSYDGDDS